MTPAANMAEVETDSQTVEDIAERLLITPMAVNPLVALDRTQLEMNQRRRPCVRRPRW